MSGTFLAFTIADLAGVATLWLVTRSGGRHAWAWSIAAWAGVAGVCTGLIPLATIVPLAALTFVIGVGLIAPLVGVIAALVVVATPVVLAHGAWGWWRRRRRLRGVAAQISRA